MTARLAFQLEDLLSKTAIAELARTPPATAATAAPAANKLSEDGDTMAVMPWNKKKQQVHQELAQVREFLDPYSDRAHVDDTESDRVIVQPGKMLDKLCDHMERVAVDPFGAPNVGVEDFLTIEEVLMLVSNGLGGALVSTAAEQAADLLAREFPPELASKPILSYDLRKDGLQIDDRLQAVARDILNSQTTENPRRAADEVVPQVSELDRNDQVNLFIAIMVLFLRKLEMLSSIAGRK